MLVAVVVGEIVGEDHGELYEAGDVAVAGPGCLVDEFTLSAFADGVAVDAPFGEETADYLDGTGRMAVEEIAADEVGGAVGECVA